MSARERRRKRNRQELGGISRRQLIAAGGLTAGATLAMSGVANAAPMTFTVGSNADTTGASDCATPTNTDCTLRQAIIDANTNAGADTIVFAAALSGSTITLTNDPQSINEAVTITGPGASQLTVDGDGSYRIFYIDPATADDPVSISGLTLENGYTTGNGGAIYNNDASLTLSSSVISNSTAYGYVQGGGVYSISGDVTINSSAITGNYAGLPTGSGRGGGIYTSSGDLTITSSTVSGNTAANYSIDYNGAYGGGINSDEGDLTVDRSAIYDNDARDGGGIYLNDGDLTMTNSTVTGNSAVSDDGGGVYTGNGSMTVTSSTVTDNYAGTYGGGLRGTGPTNTVQNSIVSGNTAVEDPASADLAYDVFDVSFSLIGVPADHVNTTVPGSNLLGVDPGLGALQDNGGPTYTMEPAATSPVIDCGSDTENSVDQRGTGFPRVVDQPNRTGSTATGANQADMGAVEVSENVTITGACTNNAPPSPPSGGGATPAPVQPTPTHKKKKCKKKKHKRSAESAKKKKCKKKKKKK
jgi:hypothetical protein